MFLNTWPFIREKNKENALMFRIQNHCKFSNIFDTLNNLGWVSYSQRIMNCFVYCFMNDSYPGGPNSKAGSYPLMTLIS